jgi:hypothetical protein
MVAGIINKTLKGGDSILVKEKQNRPLFGFMIFCLDKLYGQASRSISTG